MRSDPPINTSLRWWQTRSFVLAMVVLSIVPLLWPDIPPLVDLPGHMGRYRVQLDGGAHPWLAQWYDFRWSVIGNLGIDLLLIPLAPVFGLELAVKLVVMAIPALTVAGLLWIAREVQGRIPPTALFALPLAYSFPFQFGFANFALSMALALCLFALWMRLARQGRLKLRAVVFVPLSCLLWLCHTFGWGVLGVLAFSSEMIRQHDLRKDGLRKDGRGGRGRHWVESWIRAGLGCVPLAVPIAMMILWRSGDHVTGLTSDWFNWRSKIRWALMMLRDRWMAFDIASVAVLYLVLVKAVRDPAIRYSRHLTLSAAFLLACYLLLPRTVFGSAYADMRLAPFVIAIAVIALRPKPGMSLRHGSVLAALGLAFFLVRIGATTVSYVLYDREYDRNLAALDRLPEGARLITFVGIGAGCGNEWAMSRLEHLPGIALTRRLAYANDQWSMAGGQLLTVRYAPARGFAHDPAQQVVTVRCQRRRALRSMPVALARFPRDTFDYVWLIVPPPFEPRFAQGLVPVWRDGTSVLYRVDHAVPGIDVSDAELGILPRPRPRASGRQD